MTSIDDNSVFSRESNQYHLDEIAQHLKDLLLPQPNLDMLRLSLELLDYSNRLRSWLINICETALREREMDEETRSNMEQIVASHKDVKYEAKYVVVVKGLKMLVSGELRVLKKIPNTLKYIHQTNLTEYTPKRPIVRDLLEEFFPDAEHSAPERREVNYYALKAKKLVQKCIADKLSKEAIQKTLYNDPELNTKKVQVMRLAPLFLAEHFDKCQQDWRYITSKYHLIQVIRSGEEVEEAVSGSA